MGDARREKKNERKRVRKRKSKKYYCNLNITTKLLL